MGNHELIYLPANVPRWMLNKIRTVQERLQGDNPTLAVTRTDAVRHVLTKGLEALGIDCSNIESTEAKTDDKNGA